MTVTNDVGLTQDISILRQWIGRTETVTDVINAGPARRMQATLDRRPNFTQGDELPPFWHYLYFNPEIPAAHLNEDGHERLGRFLPPVALPRRMWAGGQMDFTAPICCGETCTKTSTIQDVALKQGRSGLLCFVSVDHVFSVDGEHRFTEHQNIVYREMPEPGSPLLPAPRAPDDATDSYDVTPDPIMLFRYSALIFYSHRIHYDADYTRDVEGYPGLVVHGPLVVALLAEFGRNAFPERRLQSLNIRAASPLFAPTPFKVQMRRDTDGVRTWARGPDDALAMTVDLKFAPVQEDAEK